LIGHLALVVGKLRPKNNSYYLINPLDPGGSMNMLLVFAFSEVVFIEFAWPIMQQYLTLESV